jgi:hypothetical protein
MGGFYFHQIQNATSGPEKTQQKTQQMTTLSTPESIYWEQFKRPRCGAQGAKWLQNQKNKGEITNEQTGNYIASTVVAARKYPLFKKGG